MAQLLTIHPQNPELRLVRKAAEALRKGGVIVYPTDSTYALGCRIGDKAALQRVTRIRKLNPKHNFTLVCRDLSELAVYARVDNIAYRILKGNTPEAFTFILKATSELPRLLMHPKRKTIGIRVPEHPLVSCLLEEMGEPIISSTLILPSQTEPPTDIDDIRDELDHAVDIIIDCGFCGTEETTVVDLTGENPELLRQGKADPSAFL